MKKIAIFFALLLFNNSIVWAVYINSDVTELDASNGFYSKTYTNNTKTTNIYNFSVYQIDKPGKNENPSSIHNGEIIYTPLKKVLLPNEMEYFKIFYRGEKDDKERYYRIVISEASLAAFEDKNDKKNIYFSPTIALDSYLVVRPAKINFDYEFDKKNNLLKNKGNTYFRVIIHDSCEDENPTIFYLLPNQTYDSKKLISSGNKFIVFSGKFILIDDVCSK